MPARVTLRVPPPAGEPAGAAAAPRELVVEAAPGETLFDAGARARAGISTSCVGKGTCGLCRVRVVAGGEHLAPYGDVERVHLGNTHHLTRLRLACQARLAPSAEGAEVVVEVVPKRTARR